MPPPTTRTVRRQSGTPREGAPPRRIILGVVLLIVGLLSFVVCGALGGPGAGDSAFPTVMLVVAIVMSLAGLGCIGWSLMASSEAPERRAAPAGIKRKPGAVSARGERTA